VAVAVVTVGFATRNLFDYMFAGSLGYLFWIIMAVGLNLAKHVQEVPAGRQVSL